eukprot:2667980-Lingulodinium_polyedra.AAC.1
MRRGRSAASFSRALEAERERLALLWDAVSTKPSAWEVDLESEPFPDFSAADIAAAAAVFRHGAASAWDGARLRH